MKRGLSIRQKVTTLLTFTSSILIVGLLIVSYIINRQNIVELCESYLYDTCISASDTLYESFYGDSERNDMSVRLQYILNNLLNNLQLVMLLFLEQNMYEYLQ